MVWSGCLRGRTNGVMSHEGILALQRGEDVNAISRDKFQKISAVTSGPSPRNSFLEGYLLRSWPILVTYMSESGLAYELIATDSSDLRFQQKLSELFDGDGTIYLVSGYFTHQGYLSIRDDIRSFLERSRENTLLVVVGPSSDQFSPRIATDLWSLDEDDQVHIYKQPRGLHAKLYLRDGPDPRCIIGSANITQVAFAYNIELNIELRGGVDDTSTLSPFRDWVEELIEQSERLRRRDILPPVLIVGSVINWSNKARILPVRNVVLRAIPLLFILLLFTATARIV